MIRILIMILFGFFTFTANSQNIWKVTKEELIIKDPPFKACHASSLVELPGGNIMVAFFAGSREGARDVGIWLVTKNEKQWQKPYLIADGIVNDTLRYPCWNPVLFKSNEDTLFLFYKVGPDPRHWWGMARRSHDKGTTWSKPERLPEGILGPIKNKPIQLKDGTILCPSSVETDSTWKVHIEKTSDIGKTWVIVPLISSDSIKVIQPSLLQYGKDTLQLVCRSNQDRIMYSWSYDKGNTWTPLAKLNLFNPNSGIDAVTLKDGQQILVYNPEVSGKGWFNNRGKLNVAVSRDGINWKDIAILEDGSNKEFSYPAVIQAKDGRIHITYTYDRKNIKHVVLEYRKEN